MSLFRPIPVSLTLSLWVACSCLHGENEVAVLAQDKSYLQVKELMSAKCNSCHGALKQKAKLRLDTRASMVEGDAIVPGQAGQSLLIERVEDMGEDRMPPPEEGAALKPDEIALLRRWIDGGAKAPAGEPVPQGPSEHWAFQRPRRMPLPDNAGNPIDVLLQKRQMALGLRTQPPAQRTILIRRLYLDLIGRETSTSDDAEPTTTETEVAR